MFDKSKDELLLKCLQGKADEKEYEIAYKWIQADKSNLEYYESMRDAWIAAGIVKRQNECDCRKAWRRVARRTGIRVIGLSKIHTTWSSIAAVFILAFISGLLAYHLLYKFSPYARHTTESEYVVQAPLGAKSLIVMADSTKVWLNAGSSLRYSTGYDRKERDVYLNGEAYFEVVSNEKLPFRVHASGLVIHSLGTEFNIKAYPEEETVETTLVSGMALLERKTAEGDLERVLLRPNQRASFIRADKRIDIARVTRDEKIEEIEPEPEPAPAEKPLPEKIVVEPIVNMEVYTSWKDKRFVFESERMDDLAVKLERIYDVRISFEDEELEDYRLTGSLEQETLEQLLYAIRLTVPLDFSIKQNNVVLTLNHHLKERYNKMQN